MKLSKEKRISKKNSLSNKLISVLIIITAQSKLNGDISPLNTLRSTQCRPSSTATASEHLEPASVVVAADPVHVIHHHFEKRMDPQMQLHKFTTPSNQEQHQQGETPPPSVVSTQQTGYYDHHHDYQQPTQMSSNNITCNDGTQAGYYKRLNDHSKSWIIYLQGGGYCGSEEACQQRWARSPHLMSSSYWPSTKSVDGILSSEPKDNPYLWNANHIYVPYCSSDSWTGLSPGGSRALGTAVGSSFAFMGSQILERVLESLFEELPRQSSLYEAKFILLAGDSAGATGVILNLDKVNRIVQQKFANIASQQQQQQQSTSCWPLSSAESGTFATNQQVPGGLPPCEPSPMKAAPVVRGLADSGWFLDNEPYDSTFTRNEQQQQQPPQQSQQMRHQQRHSSTSNNNHHHKLLRLGPGQQQQPQLQNQEEVASDCDRQQCSPLQSIKQAMLYWNGQVPAACAARHPTEPWRCYFGYRAYQTLKTPLFVVQWLYDEAQLMFNNIGRPETNGQWLYVNRLVNEMLQSLQNVSALFAPSCFSHSLVIRASWNQININGFKLPHILNSWEEESLPSQPTLETLLAADNESLSILASSSLSSASSWSPFNQGTMEAPLQLQQPSPPPPLPSPLSFRVRDYERSLSTTNFELRHVPPQKPSRHKSRKRKRNNSNNHHRQQQHSLPNSTSQSAATAAVTNRLSRSTTATVVDNNESLVLSNNVPEALMLAHRQYDSVVDRFKLIDTCGWPQCNRDCPLLEPDSSNVRLL